MYNEFSIFGLIRQVSDGMEIELGFRNVCARAHSHFCVLIGIESYRNCSNSHKLEWNQSQCIQNSIGKKRINLMIKTIRNIMVGQNNTNQTLPNPPTNKNCGTAGAR